MSGLGFLLRLRDLFLRQRAWTFLLLGCVAVLALFYCCHAFVRGIDHDEVEHAHVAFKLLNGQLPYRDFYENHFPSYWLLGMPLVSAFPFSVNAIVAARVLNLVMLAGCWALGLRLLWSIRGGRTWLGIAIYSWAVITVAFELDFLLARPDPLMTLFATAGLCLTPAAGRISGRRALLLGLLFGLSASVCPKVFPMLLVLPALLAFHCLQDKKLRPALALIPYGLGGVLALLPTAIWIFQNDLFDAFWFDVIELNRALSKPWFRSLHIVDITVYPAAVLGTLALLWNYKRPSRRDDNRPLLVMLAMVAGLGLAFMIRHWSPYNFQVLLIPLAIGFTSLALGLVLHLRGLGYRVLLCGALIGFSTLNITTPLLASVLLGLPVGPPHLLPMDEVQATMDLARPGDRTCIAFAPAHPVFCHDISGLNKAWDYSFARGLRDPAQRKRFRKLWHEGIQNTLEQQPDIILRRDFYDLWQAAVNAKLVTPEELQALDALKVNYDVVITEHQEIWVKKR